MTHGTGQHDEQADEHAAAESAASWSATSVEGEARSESDAYPPERHANDSGHPVVGNDTERQYPDYQAASGYDEGSYPGYGEAAPQRYDQPPYEQPPDAQQASYEQAPYEQAPYEQAPYEQAPYEQAPYEQAPYEQTPHQQGQYDHASYEQDPYRQAPYQQAPREQPGYQPPGYQPPGYQPPGYQQQYDTPPGDPAQSFQPDAAQSFQPDAAQSFQPVQAQPQGTGRHHSPEQQFVPQQPSYQPPPPPPIPKPEDLLVPDQSPVTTQPASWGWRGRLNRASGGLFKTKASEVELVARTAISDIQRGFSRPMTVVVVQPKGGAGKTPTTICLSAAFGAHRGGYVVGWDNNETRGTLAVRVSNPDSQRATVWDLLSDLAAFERFDARVGDLSRYVRPQPDAHFDALVSDDNPGNMAEIGEEEFNRLHKVLQRFYRMVVVDTGNNVRSLNWQAAVNTADLIVVVSTYQRDVGYSGSWVLDHLAQTGREELARNAVTILSAADPTTDKTVRDQLLEHFRARTRAVCEIPYDSELAHGGPIRWSELADETRNAWIRAGATVVNCLAADDRDAVARRA